ncbi:hypothetical protein ACIQVR_26830 [Streptomyces xanthochromogenes]|uniref:hypothetical protein n=1 Tax=Streptomyces xanthochromogenes TaxID=67384 RepID=UPI0037F110ED
MAKITELGLDDDLPASRWARSTMAGIHRGDHDQELTHDFRRLPSYEGYAGMCSGCGWEYEGAAESMGPLLSAYTLHVVDQAAETYEIGEVLGFQKLAPEGEDRTDWVGRASGGSLVVGAAGWVQLDPKGNHIAHGTWTKFKRPQHAAEDVTEG